MPGCNFCFNLGKHDYDTHNLKDSFGNTTCPALQYTKCLKCGYFGHTARYCDLADENDIEMPKRSPNRGLGGVVIFEDVCGDDICDDICGEVCDEDCDENGLVKGKATFYNSLDAVEVEATSKLGAFHLNNVVWGVGTVGMIGKRWGDVTDKEKENAGRN